ncbi:MAG: STAS domain-containing protein [Eubacterium sp.]|nr:STAS domain-containing protein [Eubacterium sp.]
MNYEEILMEGMLQLNIEGKIDALTSDEFQTLVLRSFMKSNNVILNMEKVKYMSSAGLRALVLGQKTAQSKGGKLIIINLQDQVRDTFVVTGFDGILDIR